MKQDFKIFNKINLNLDKFDNENLNYEEINMIKNRLNNKLKIRNKNHRNIAISVAALAIILTTLTLTNETTLANISKANEVIKTKINKAIGKYKDDKSTIVFEEKVSHNVIVYNTHNLERYDNGVTVVDLGKSISNTLNNINVDSIFINGGTSSYEDAYEYANALVQNNIYGFENSFLVDIHYGPPNTDNENTFKFVLTENNPYYEETKKIAELMKSEIEKISDINVGIFSYNRAPSNFNQDLSAKSMLVDIGNKFTSKENLDKAIDVFSKALKNVMKTY